MPKRRQPRSCFNLGMNRCRCQKPLASGGWRFTGKLFFGRGFATVQIAGRCSGFAGAAIAGSDTAGWSVASRRDAGSIERPIGAIRGAPKVVWIIAIGSVRIVAGSCGAA